MMSCVLAWHLTKSSENKEAFGKTYCFIVFENKHMGPNVLLHSMFMPRRLICYKVRSYLDVHSQHCSLYMFLKCSPLLLTFLTVFSHLASWTAAASRNRITHCTITITVLRAASTKLPFWTFWWRDIKTHTCIWHSAFGIEPQAQAWLSFWINWNLRRANTLWCCLSFFL